MTFSPALLDRAGAVIEGCRQRGWRIATAESCTGGLVSGLLTEIAGSSAVVLCGFVTYSNEAKSEMVGVAADLIARHGAVSAPVARAMADGALERSGADLSVAITGIAGPSGGSAEKPVGLVHFGIARRHTATRHLERRYGALGRAEVRMRAVGDAMGLIEAALSDAAS